MKTSILIAGLLSIISTGTAHAASYVLVAETDEGCKLYLDGMDLVQEGCNVHVRNGDGQTNTTPNGLGNLTAVPGYSDAITPACLNHARASFGVTVSMA